MEPVVPPEVTVELTQILSNLVLGDNEIRTRFVFEISRATLQHAIPLTLQLLIVRRQL